MKTYRAKILPLSALFEPTEFGRWQSLSQRAYSPTPFLSPWYKQPALKYLTPHLNPTAVVVEKTDASSRDFSAIGLFVPHPADRRFPASRMISHHSVHSYLLGILGSDDSDPGVMAEFFGAISEMGKAWSILELKNIPAEMISPQILTAAESHGYVWFEATRYLRPKLTVARAAEQLKEHQSNKKKWKEIGRLRRNLAELGKVEWSIVSGKAIDKSHIERFLELEHSGWRGENGSSLLSDSRPGHADFFREMVMGGAHFNEVFFTEMKLNGIAIASTLNFSTGRLGYAFKIGWDTYYKKLGLGVLNEIAFIENIAEHYPHIEYFDSGSAPSSFIGDYWTERRPIISGFFIRPAWAQWLKRSIQAVRKIKQSGKVLCLFMLMSLQSVITTLVETS